MPVEASRADWQPPIDAAWLPHFHITLLGRKRFLDVENEMARVWQSVCIVLSTSPNPDLGAEVHLAVDDDRKTWFRSVVNQGDFRSYVRVLKRILDENFRHLCGIGFTNPETDRYFHVSIANNQGGDPMKSVGSVWLHCNTATLPWSGIRQRCLID